MRIAYQLHWLMLVLTILLSYPAPSSSAQKDDEVLALVNKAPITRQDLTIEMAMLNAEIEHRNQSLSNHQMAKLSRQLVDNLIHRELLYQRAQQKKITIKNRWLDRALNDFKAKLKPKSAYNAYLKKSQLSETQFRKHIQKGLIIRRLLRREAIRQVKVSEAEMQAFYRHNPDFFKQQEQIRLRQIMVSVDSPDDISQRGDALLRIQNIQKRISEGGNFAALALEHSEDSSKSNGGDLGYLEHDQIIKPLTDASSSLKTGEISDIIETRLGYHLIQMVDRRPSSQLAYRNVRTKIERTIRRNKEKKATDAYLARLMRAASIQRLNQ